MYRIALYCVLAVKHQMQEEDQIVCVGVCWGVIERLGVVGVAATGVDDIAVVDVTLWMSSTGLVAVFGVSGVGAFGVKEGV